MSRVDPPHGMVQGYLTSIFSLGFSTCKDYDPCQPSITPTHSHHRSTGGVQNQVARHREMMRQHFQRKDEAPQSMPRSNSGSFSVTPTLDVAGTSEFGLER